MARSQEKAMSALNRWVDQRRAVEAGIEGSGRAPRFPSECRSIKQGEAARSQISRQISASIALIQNATLGEQRIRDLNDEINRLIRSKYAWEIQIRSLGGPDYTKSQSAIWENEGLELPGQGGYKYFGVAKELPGIRELLEDHVAFHYERRSRKDLLMHVNSDYYGWSDDQCESILVDEHTAETQIRDKLDDIRGQRRLGSVDDVEKGGKLEEVFDMAISCNKTSLDRVLLQKKKEKLFAMMHGTDGPQVAVHQAQPRDRVDECESNHIGAGVVGIELVE